MHDTLGDGGLLPRLRPGAGDHRAGSGRRGLTMTTHRLTHPPDIDRAYDAWQANCGPCSLAAVLGRPVMRVKTLFPHFAAGRYFTNVTHMRQALADVGHV